MEPYKVTMASINIVGGIAVLGSYAYGIATHPQTAGDIWGGVPEWLKPYYTVSMLSAAAGYFLFSYFLFFEVDAARARVASRFEFDLINFIYLLILVPSALWMPLTFRMLEQPSPALWMAIRLVLAVVGIASIALIVSLVLLNQREPTWAFALAIAGSVAFAVQTAVLDAIVWPAYFPT